MKVARSLQLVLLISICLGSSLSALAQQWRPMDPAHLEMKAPSVEKDADAEALLWEVYINDSSDTTTDFIHYLRVKIFNDRGKETQSKVEIPYYNGVQIKDIAARTIKPDGTVIDLKKDAIFDREIVKVGRLKFKAKSFALPGIEAGTIIEYQWREVYESGANYVKMDFQREIPVQLVRYYLKPYAGMIYPMQAITFQGNPSPFTKDKSGYHFTQMTNVPAFREEPRMPPEDQVKTWMLVYYAPKVNKDPRTYWMDLGKEYHDLMKGEMKVNDDIRRAATEAIGDAATSEQKLERLFNFCRTKIKNITDDASGITVEQLMKMKDNKSPADTLKRGYGTSTDIDSLFGALAAGAGFEARYVRIGDRSRKFFDPSFTNPYFMRHWSIAVKVDGNWKFFDPGSTYVPFGMLRWQEEGIGALVTDQKEPAVIQTPVTPAEKSKQKRVAKLRLSEDGTLEGDIRIEYTGHFAVEMKEDADEETAEQREAKVRDGVKRRLGADVTDIKVESATDPLKPFAYSYKVRVPGYAERTGKRLFIQPAFFQRNVGPLFPTSTRQHDIYFHYSWSEEDQVIIELPAGYALDNAEAPSPMNFGEVGGYDVTLQISTDQKFLVYQRKLKFSGMIFPKATYPSLKKAFDAIHQQDNHAVTLKQGTAAAMEKK
jgi:hypothetical protein